MKEYAVQTTKLRQQCLPELRAANVSQVGATYNGCGDSGNIDHLSVDPELPSTSCGLEEKLRDLMWRLAYQTNPGFEINEGGGGDIIWVISTDVVTIEHWTPVTDYENSTHENV